MDAINYKITKILDKVSLSNGAETQECIIEEQDSQYPNSLKIQFYGDKVMMLNGKKQGDVVDCKLNFKTRENKGNYYTNISCRSMKQIKTVGNKMDDRSNRQANRFEVGENSGLPF